MVPNARSALTLPLSALLASLIAAGCSSGTVGQRVVPSPSLGGRTPQLRVILDGRPLHPDVASVTLQPNESMLLLDRASIPLVPARPHLAVRSTGEGKPVRWQAEHGTVTVEQAGLRGHARYAAPATPGMDRLQAFSEDAPTGVLAEIVILTVTPFDAVHAEHLGSYRIGRYPPPPDAATPYARARRSMVAGFVEVTSDNRATRLSSHVRLRDLECKQTHAGSSRYLALDVRLLDKLERLVDLLTARGIPGTALTIMSGYRTPYYNRRIGNRTPWSRHVMGDAVDVFVDGDGDGNMDDLDGDGRVSRADAEVLLVLVDILDDDPALVGGAAAYPGTATHGPFVHLDTRGYRARW